jgi:hypothetical protein
MHASSLGFYIETIHDEYKENDPIFFDKNKFAWVAELEGIYKNIMEELSPIFENDFSNLITNPEVHIQFPPQIWKGYPFYFNGLKIKKHLKHFPFIEKELSRIPNLITASISVLEPGSWLLPHNGSTNAIMRVHLPLKIPGKFPDCGMTIAGHEISWEEGKILMFCDMHVHSVRNLTKERRFILMMDVMRPEYISFKQKVCVHTIGRIAANVIRNYLKIIFRVPFEKQNPNKEELKYEANKTYTKKTSSQQSVRTYDLIISFGEKTVLYVCIGLVSIYFSIKRLLNETV